MMLTPSYGQNLTTDLIDGVHNRVKTAASAAELVLKVDAQRREADRLRRAGQLSDARAQLHAAEAIMTSAASEDESLQSDGLLRDYLTRLQTELLTLDSATTPEPRKGASSVDHINAADRFIGKVLAEYGLPQWLTAVVVVESGGNPSALSPKGARGLWQLMPGTARRYGLRVDDGVDERLDPMKSTYAAVRYLRDLYGTFQEWPLTLAAYNAGEDRIQKVMATTGIRLFEEMARGRLLPDETIHYVPAVLNLMPPNVGQQERR